MIIFNLSTYLEYVHFNDDAPENKNICITNKRDNTVNVFDGKSWNLRDKQECLEEIKEKGVGFIEQKISQLDENKKNDQLILKKIKRFIEWFHNYDDRDTEDEHEKIKRKENKEKLKDIDKKISLILYNNRQSYQKNLILF